MTPTVARRRLRIAVLAACAAVASQARAFHSGGVGACEGCHSMHNSLAGEPMVAGAAAGQGSGPYLLRAADPSSTCLACHATTGLAPSSYHVVTLGIEPSGTPAQMTPGGDFSWLRIGWRNGRTGVTPSPNPRHGHNVVAVDYGYVADGRLTSAPGGDYPADSLHCTSCHDPHGRHRRFADGSVATTGLPIMGSGSYDVSGDPVADVYAVGVYRILAGVGYQPKSLSGSYAFTSAPPAAVAPSSYNRAETTQQTQTFVAYGRGTSEWCANCHAAFLSNGYTSGMPGLRHPAGETARLTASVAADYNAYVTSGRMTNTDPAQAYSTLTPFELGTADYAVLKAWAQPSGAVDRSASVQDNVTCLSCHRAHAGGFDSLLRFSLEAEFMTTVDASGAAMYPIAGTAGGTVEQIQGAGYSARMTQAAYYGRPASYFGPFARVQCNKCHAKD